MRNNLIHWSHCKISLTLMLLWFANTSVFSQNLPVFYTFEQAKTKNPDSVFYLSMGKMRLEEIPEIVFTFKNLRGLDLSRNKLKYLPEEIKSLTKLELLIASKNKIDAFPSVICSLTNLKRLDLGSNSFETLPDSLIKLTNLETLELWDTPISTFPDFLPEMTWIQKIDVTGNLYNKVYQTKWRELMPTVRILFDAPCNCD